MTYYPANTSGLDYETYPPGPTAIPLSIASGTSPAKGSYVEFAASAAFTANAVAINILLAGSAAAGRSWLFDLATGAAGAETVVVPNLIVDLPNATFASFAGGEYQLPLAIASGARISGRCACSSSLVALRVAITIVAAGGVVGIGSFVDYGTDTTNIRGVAVDPGGTTNTKAAYSQISASLSAVMQWLCFSWTCGKNAAPSTADWSFDVATGAAGAETILIPDLRARLMTGPVGGRPQTFLTYIASGTRVAVRASCSINDATDRLVDVVIYGGTAPSEATGGEHALVFLL